MQKARALSSVDYAMATGYEERLGSQSMGLGWSMAARVRTDSNAANSVANRRGLGKLS